VRYVKACEFCDWHIVVHPPGDPENSRRVPYKCRSWRHAGDCRLWKGAQDFARCKEAIATRPDWTYIVLTFPQREWPDKTALYKAGCSMWSKLRLRLRRRWGELAYIQTWERHANGGAHVNVLVGNPLIHISCTSDRRSWRRYELEPMAVACGFGKRTYVEVLRQGSGDSMAGYLVKLARELTGASVKSQIPVDAPPHFRRLRASQGLLPRPVKSGLTGHMVFAPIMAYLGGDAARKDGRSRFQQGKAESAMPQTTDE